MSVFPGAPEVILDSAHTPESVDASLAEAGLRDARGPVTVLALAEDKSASKIVARAAAGSRDLVFTTYPGGRAFPPDRLRDLGRGKGCVISDPHEALRRARKLAGREGTVLITGSFYLAGALRERLLRGDP